MTSCLQNLIGTGFTKWHVTKSKQNGQKENQSKLA